MPDVNTITIVGDLRVHLVHKVAHSSIEYALIDAMTGRAAPDSEDANGGFHFMAVRHPLDRIVSAWAFFCMKPKKELQDYMVKIGYKLNQPFDEFLDILLERHDENVHTRKQIWFKGHHDINFLVKMENLSKSWGMLKTKFPAIKPLGFFNSSDHDRWETYYSDAQRERAESVFHEDMLLYNLAI